MLDINSIRSDFPILKQKVNGKPLIYFDNAATTQKPKAVIDAMSDFYVSSNANVHRGIYDLSEKATQLYEDSRKKVAKFINAKSEKEIVFVRNTTEAINLLAYCLKPREVTVSVAEHHSNYLPWERVAKLNVKKIGEKLTGDFIAVNHASNVLGKINEREILDAARMTKVLIVDGAQAVPHFKVDVQKLGCTAYAFSSHKMYGPMGIGILWAKQELLEKLSPFLVGGGMISGELPEKFEAGTPDVAGVVGLGTAIDYLEKIGWGDIQKQEKLLTDKFLKEIEDLKELKLYGPQTAENRVPVFSFNIRGIHPHDAAQFLNDRYGIAVRAGQHCAAPLHHFLGIHSTIRASLSFYNTEQEIDLFVKAIKELTKIFSKKE